MSRYLVTRPARGDILEIWTYLADHAGVERADRVLDDLHAAMARIANWPGLGHARRDIGDEALRVFVVHSYLIIYDPDTRPLQVVRVLHGARDVQALLGSGEGE